MAEETVNFWQDKCQNLEQVIKTLSTHCMKVVEKYEELLTNYNKNQDQYDKLLKILKQRGEQIQKARDVLGPVSIEYKALREKYESAVQGQYVAENYAKKMYKRQSQMMDNRMQAVEINLDDEDNEPVDALQEDYIKTLNQKIEDLETEKSFLSAKMKDLEEDKEIERNKNEDYRHKIEIYRAELQRSKQRLDKQDHHLKLLAQTSEAALEEYQQLQREFEKEVTDRVTAERAASNLYAEKEGLKRQSAVYFEKVAGDTKLMKELIDVEELTTKLELQKAEYEQKIKQLEEDLASFQKEENITVAETEKAQLEMEKVSLEQRLLESENSVSELKSQYESLKEKYAKLEDEMKNKIPIAPPPPPPPPPPPQNKLGSIFKFGAAKKKKKEIQKNLGSEGYSKAMDEMMKKLKEGSVGLRPVLKKRTHSLPEEETSTAMQELQGILTKMKKARSVEDLTDFDDQAFSEETELGQAFRKVQTKDKSGRPVPQPRKLSTISDRPEDENED